MACPAAALFEQIAGLQSRVPAVAIVLWPLIDGFAPSLSAVRQDCGHFCRSERVLRILLVLLWPPVLLSRRKCRMVLSKCRTAAGVSKPV